MAKSKTPVSPWRNRIIGYGEVVTADIVANPLNWRMHPPEQTDALAGILGDVGLVQNIIINQRTGEQWPEAERGTPVLVDGHARVALALHEGQPTLPATYVELTPGEEAEILATLDPVAALAQADREKLAGLLGTVQSGNAAVQQMLSQLAEQEKIIPTAEPVAPDAFKKYDENIETEHTCPKCGYQFSGGA